MRFSFPCPQCKQPVEAEGHYAGAMIFCKYCLLGFPIPEVTFPPPAPPKIEPEPEIDIAISRLSADSAWRLVSLGLTVLQISMVILPGAGIVWFTLLGLMLSAPDWPVQILPLCVALGSLVTGFLGICLCCNAPDVPSLRIYPRVSLGLVLLAALAGAATFVLGRGGIWLAAVALCPIVWLSGIAGIILWVYFLKGVAEFFNNTALSNSAVTLVAATVHGLTLNLCLITPISLIAGISVLTIVPFLIPCLLYVWLLTLVIRVRRAILIRNYRAP